MFDLVKQLLKKKAQTSDIKKVLTKRLNMPNVSGLISPSNSDLTNYLLVNAHVCFH